MKKENRREKEIEKYSKFLLKLSDEKFDKAYDCLINYPSDSLYLEAAINVMRIKIEKRINKLNKI